MPETAFVHAADGAAAMPPFNEAYAPAMATLANQFPDDLDVQVLYAQSLMDVNPSDRSSSSKERSWLVPNRTARFPCAKN